MTSRIDANQHTTAYAYDKSGHLTKITDPLNRSTYYAYDADGNRTTITNARSQTITSTFDSRDLPGNLLGPAVSWMRGLFHSRVQVSAHSGLSANAFRALREGKGYPSSLVRPGSVPLANADAPAGSRTAASSAADHGR